MDQTNEDAEQEPMRSRVSGRGAAGMVAVWTIGFGRQADGRRGSARGVVSECGCKVEIEVRQDIHTGPGGQATTIIIR